MTFASTRKFLPAAIAAAGLIAAATPALGQLTPRSTDLGFYAGGAVGQAKFKGACSDITGTGFVGGCDDKDTAWKIFGGYQFHRNVAVELGYVDLGEASASGTILGVPASASAEVKALELVAVGILPLTTQFSAYGKAGAFRWDVDTRAAAGAVAVGGGDDGTDFTYGVGLKYDFTRNLAARVEWQRYNNVGESNTTGQADVNMWSVGLMFRF
ncbi:MAG: outer membrane beta-barrel protein [Betaproteobacteria bacterium]